MTRSFLRLQHALAIRGAEAATSRSPQEK